MKPERISADGKTKNCHHLVKEVDVKQKISVILPVHNAEKELVSLVNDCFETTGDIKAECEIVIIDDASTDASGDIAENLSLEYPQIKVVSQWRSLGIQKSILNGLRQANGDLLYIYYMQSGYQFPQISFFFEAMTFTDVVLGRFLNHEDGFVGMAMLKKQTLPLLGNMVAFPEEAVSLMSKNSIRFLELRYDSGGGRRMPNIAEPVKTGPFKRIMKSTVSTP